jgi:acyl-coenzyme A thioesterase 13
MGSEDVVDISHVKGNASDEIKRIVGDPVAFFRRFRTLDFKSQLFGETIADRLRVTEISLYEKPEEPKKMEAKVIVEITVKEGTYQPELAYN